MSYALTLYYDTGFGGLDVPLNPSALNGATNRVFPDVYFLREDIDLPTIKVKAPYKDVRDADYAKLTDSTTGENFYYFCNVKALAKQTTLVALELDALMTLGGADHLTYISGMQTRGHIPAAEDTLYANTAPEEWTPAEPLVVKEAQTLTPPGTMQTDTSILITSTDLEELATGNTDEQEVIAGIVSGQTTPEMYFPKVSPTPYKTVFAMYDFASAAHANFVLPGSAAFDGDDAGTRTALKKLYSSGQLQLQMAYGLPKQWHDAATKQDLHYYDITGAHSDDTTTLLHEFTISGYTIKNKKVFALFREFVLANQGSGAMDTATPADLYDGSTAPHVLQWSDPSSVGKPYARWKYIKGNPLQWSRVVGGTQWASDAIVLEGAPGSAWNALTRGYELARLSQAQTEAEMNRGFEKMKELQTAAGSAAAYELKVQGQELGFYTNLLGSAAGLDLGGMLSTVGNTALEAARAQSARSFEVQAQEINRAESQARFELAEQARERERNESGLNYYKSTVHAPEVLFTPSINLALYGYDRFSVYEVRLPDEEVQALDDYFQRYGYSGLHKPLTASCFTARQYFNFVQATDVNIQSTAPLRVRQKAIAQLNSGRRFWKAKPDPVRYAQN